jgi:transposase
MNFLSPNQRSVFEAQAKKTRDTNERNRLCVLLARDDGFEPDVIAQILRLSRSSVYEYLRDYQLEQKTINDLQGGSKSKLSEQQTEELIEHLSQYTYRKVKDICGYVLKRYQISYSVGGMTSWLKKCKFVFKSPANVPGKLDLEKQAQFIKKYEELKASCQKGEEIYFLDAVHPAYQSQAVCGWIQKGVQKTIKTTNKQTRLHIVGALRLKDMQIRAKEYSTVKGEQIIDFLKDLENQSLASKIYVILDNGRANKNKLVQAYLNNSKIQLIYLPPYSPNLNPIERLWKVMREVVTYNKFYDKFTEFEKGVRKFFTEKIPNLLDKLKIRINDKFQLIKLNPVQLSA